MVVFSKLLNHYADAGVIEDWARITLLGLILLRERMYRYGITLQAEEDALTYSATVGYEEEAASFTCPLCGEALTQSMVYLHNCVS